MNIFRFTEENYLFIFQCKSKDVSYIFLFYDVQYDIKMQFVVSGMGCRCFFALSCDGAL